jgi:hypothetical protein
MAAMLLNNADMKAACAPVITPYFQEDEGHLYITATETNYPEAMHGMPERTSVATRPHLMNPYWGSPPADSGWEKGGYRYICGQSGLMNTIVITLMNGHDVWADPAFTEYHIDRYWPIEYFQLTADPVWPVNPYTDPIVPEPNRSVGSTNGITKFTAEIWNAHMTGAPPPDPPADVTAPTYVSGSINQAGNRLTVQFSESVVNVDTAHYTLSGGHSLTASSGGGATHVWAISPIVTVDEVLTLGFTSGAGRTQDAAGNLLATFSGSAVINDSLETTPVPPRAGRRGRGGGQNIPLSR